MVRLTRAQQQERTRAAVLAAARAEFGERGYAEAKIDRIAERADLTRGAVYSNFPGKRALYLAVLVDSVEAGESPGEGAAAGFDPGEGLGAFARVWLERLPLMGDTAADGKLRSRSLAGLFDDEPGRTVVAQIARLEALLLGLTLESGDRRRTRRVRSAEVALTLLTGAGHLAETAPGFGDPFDIARACARFTDIDLADAWDPPHLAYVEPAPLVDEGWQPPAEELDQITGGPVGFDADGVIAVLGTRRLASAEDAVRAARPGDRVTLAVVTSDPAEIGRLVRLRIGDLTACVRRAFAPIAWPRLQLVLDTDGAVAAAIGVPDKDDETEAAVRIRAGRVVARASGRGSLHAVAAAAGDTESSRVDGHRRAEP